MKNSIFFGLAAILALALVSQAEAQGKKGSASVAAATTCALHIDENVAELVVSTTLTNKSSGGVTPNVTSAEIDGTYKPIAQKGNVNFVFDDETFGAQGSVNPTLTITAEFDLCRATDVSGNLIIDVARELNGKSTVNYGPGARTVTSQCSADPITEEGGGIKVADVIHLIEAACGL